MTQFTPKTLEEALLWIHTHRHHEVGAIWHNNTPRWNEMPIGWFYKNGQETLRVMRRYGYVDRFHRFIVPETRAHDDRLYRVTPSGRRLIRGLYDKREHP